MIVVDASVMIANLLPDERENLTFFVDLADEESLIAPCHFLAEVLNTLRMAERRGRCGSDGLFRILDLFYTFDVRLEEPEARSQIPRLLELSRAHQLTVYDAAYLTLARRTGSPLATYDRALRRAAIAEGIPVRPTSTAP